VCLQVPHHIQTFLSGSSTLCMANIIPLFKLFMEDWENQARVKLQYCATIRAGLKVAVKHYKCMNNTNAYTIVMCKSYILELHISDIFHDVVLHPLYCMEHITEFWGDNYISKAKEQIKEKVSTLPMEVLMLISTAPGIRCKRTKKNTFQTMYWLPLLWPSVSLSTQACKGCTTRSTHSKFTTWETSP
ncbi:hypothetical protein FOMPIDRAFT_64104, partial [Fomitopsis schrenkii]